MQVRINAGTPWLTLHGPAFCAELGNPEYQRLLTPDQLTINCYAEWIALHSKLDGLTWVVARPFSGAVQTRVLLLTTIIEGFHRALPGYEKRKFPGVDKVVLYRILEAARNATIPPLPLRLTGADVVAFLLRESGRVSVGAAKGRVAELRSLLKFVYLPGLTGPAVNHGGAARRRLARLWSDGLLMTTTMRRSPRTPPHSLAKQYIR